MSHLFRFFGQKSAEGRWSLASFEIEHARKVLKLKSGDAVEVMDGKGRVAQGVVESLSRDEVTVRTSGETTSEPPKFLTAIALGALKPGDFDDILPGLVEWGLGEIHVFQQKDTAKFRTADKAQERWDRIILAAVKQCKRPWLPSLFVHPSLEDFVNSAGQFSTKLVLDASGQLPMRDAVRANESVVAVVGGERGLSDVEVAYLKTSGFSCVNLGPNILRARTAALGVATILAT